MGLRPPYIGLYVVISITKLKQHKVRLENVIKERQGISLKVIIFFVEILKKKTEYLLGFFFFRTGC